MTPKQKAYRNKLLSKIHQSPRYRSVYANDRDLWESFLQNAYGVHSSADLLISELENLSAYLSGKASVLIADPSRRSEREGKATKAQIAKIETMWSKVARDKSDMALRNFIHRQVKSRPLHLYHLTQAEATVIIVSLVAMHKEGGAA
ncbi:MAG: DUF1018 domain-containing protein [Campylobacterales bacterium]|nr:DUF1018 domain-containing protein [Campylobacterales bacterium]